MRKKTAFKEDIAAEVIKNKIQVRVFMYIVWIISGALMLYYTSRIIQQRIDAVDAPASTVLYDTATRLPMPRAIICNWNQNGSPSNPAPTTPCEECELNLVSCLNLNTSSDCSSDWTRTYVYTSVGIFSCYIYNQDPDNVTYTLTTAYGGAIQTLFQVKKFPAEDPPVSRCGAQISFLLNDGTKIPEDLLWQETNFAPLSVDSFFTLQLVSTVHLEKPKSDPDYNTTRFVTTVSTVDLMGTQNDTYAYVGISFAYQTLSKQTIQFSVSYTIDNLFGDFAGMLGTLMGLDTIKVASALPLFYLAVKMRSIKILEDHFNG